MKGLKTLYRRELALAWSGGGGPLLACGFFLCLTVLVPLAVGGDPSRLTPLSGGVAWLGRDMAALDDASLKAQRREMQVAMEHFRSTGEVS